VTLWLPHVDGNDDEDDDDDDDEAQSKNIYTEKFLFWLAWN